MGKNLGFGLMNYIYIMQCSPENRTNRKLYLSILLSRGAGLKVDVAVLSPKLEGRRAGKSFREGFYVAVLRHNYIFGKPQLLLLEPSTDQVRPTQTKESNQLYSKATDYKY